MNPYRILVVEDEAIVAMDIEDRLAGMGYQLAGRAVSGEQALELAEKQHPNLTLMDIRLQGGMDGISVADEMRRRFHIPVIFLTAYSEDATLERAKLTEPFGYILKPFNDRELRSTIEIALYKHRAEEEIRRMNRLYNVLSQVNQAIVRIGSRDELLPTVCRLVVERGSVDLAWIGCLDTATCRIVPVAHFGNKSDMLSQVQFYATDRPEEQGNPGRAVRENRPFLCNECVSGACLFPSDKAPARFGFRSCASFPLWFQGQVWGALNLCVAEPGFFGDREIDLLKEVALDISFALDSIEGNTQRERLNEQLQQHSAFLQTLIDSMPYMVFYKDAQLRYIGCNTLYERFVGLRRDQLIGKTVYDVWPGEQAEEYDRYDRQQLVSAEPHRHEALMQAADGGQHHIMYNKSVFRNPDGSVSGIIGAALDITDRKRTEEALRKSEQEYRRIFDTAMEGIVVFDENFSVSLVNKRVTEMFHCAPEDMLGKQMNSFLFEEDVPGIMERRKRRRQGIPEQSEWRFRRKDGTALWVYISTTPIMDDEGRFLGAFAMHTDITQRKEAEKTLKESEEKYRSIFENAVEGIYQSTPEGRFVSVNPAMAHMYGYESPEDMIRSVTNIGRQLYANSEDRRRYQSLLEENGVLKDCETPCLKKNGGALWVSLSAHTIKDANGTILYYEGIVEDITARKLAEEALKQSMEKLRKSLISTIQVISLTVETRDPYTAGHQRRVSNLARSIAQEMGLPKDSIDNIRMAGAIHDIGKMSIPAEILAKPSKLTDIERALIKVHPQAGYDILKDVNLPWPIADIVLQHHERLDGSGYPRGLKGGDILLDAQIVAVADVVEAIASHRPYRPGYGIDMALEEVENNKGSLYGALVVEACVRLFREKGFEFE